MLTKVPALAPWSGPRPSLGASLLIAVGAAGLIARTEDSGDHWAEIPSGITTQLNSVAFGLDVWVAVGESGKILLSHDDGKTWAATPSPVTVGINAIEYSGGVFCFYARGTTAATRLFWSVDGVSWTSINCTIDSPGTVGWGSGAANGVFTFSHVGGYQSALVVRTPKHKDGVYVNLAPGGYGSTYYGVYASGMSADGILGEVGQATKLSVGSPLTVSPQQLSIVYTGGSDSRVWNDVFYDKTRGMWVMCGGSNQIEGGTAIAQAVVKGTYAPVTVGSSAANIVAAVGSLPAYCLTATAKRCFIAGAAGKIAGAANWNEAFTTLVTFTRKVYCIAPAVSA